MSKYDYDAIGFHRSYESYVKVREEHPVEGMVIPTKEEYESKRDADFEHGIKVRKANNMISSLQNVRTEDIDLLMQVYDVVAPILNLKSTEEVTDEVILELKKKHLKNLMAQRRVLKKQYKEESSKGNGSAWKIFAEVMTLTVKINELKEELKGE